MLKKWSKKRRKVFWISVILVIFWFLIVLLCAYIWTLAQKYGWHHQNFLSDFKRNLGSWQNWLISFSIFLILFLLWNERYLRKRTFIRKSENNDLGKSEWMINMLEEKIPKSNREKFDCTFPMNREPGFVVCTEQNSSNELFFHQVKNQHILVLGGSGSGKTQNIIMPTIYRNSQLENRPNMVISDVKGELTLKFSDFLRDQGYQVSVFDLINPLSDKNNICLNPLSAIKETFIKTLEFPLKKAQYLRDIDSRINLLATTLLTVSSDKDAFWVNQARNVLKGLIWLMLDLLNIQRYYCKTALPWISDLQFTLATACHLISDKAKLKLIAELIAKINPNSRSWELFANTVFIPDATSAGFFSHFQEGMEIFRDSAIEYLTSKTTISFKDFFEKPSVIFIKTSPEDKAHYPLAGLIVNILCHYARDVTNRSSENTLERPLLFILDEFANFPIIQDFEIKISTYRSMKIFFALVLQSLNQLKNYRHYAKTILENLSTKIYLRTSTADAETLSKEIGEKTIIQTSYSYSDGGGNINRNNKSDHKSSSHNESISKVPLISVSEIVSLPESYGIITSSSKQPSLVKFTPAYQTIIKEINNKHKNEESSTVEYDMNDLRVNTNDVIKALENCLEKVNEQNNADKYFTNHEQAKLDKAYQEIDFEKPSFQKFKRRIEDKTLIKESDNENSNFKKYYRELREEFDKLDSLNKYFSDYLLEEIKYLKDFFEEKEIYEEEWLNDSNLQSDEKRRRQNILKRLERCNFVTDYANLVTQLVDYLEKLEVAERQ